MGDEEMTHAPSNAPSNASSNAPRMQNAMHSAMHERTQRTQLTRRIQDLGENPRVPSAAGPVDKGVPVKQVRIDGVEIQARAWFKLATLAEKRGLTVAQVVAAGVEAMVAEPAYKPEAAQFGRMTTPAERRKMTPRRKQRCSELYAIGLTDREIAKRIGMSDEAVRLWRNNMQLPVIRRGRRSDADLKRIEAITTKASTAA